MGKTNQKPRGEKRAEEKANRLIKNICLALVVLALCLIALAIVSL